jgi:hypothetical protein
LAAYCSSGQSPYWSQPCFSGHSPYYSSHCFSVTALIAPSPYCSSGHSPYCSHSPLLPLHNEPPIALTSHLITQAGRGSPLLNAKADHSTCDGIQYYQIFITRGLTKQEAFPVITSRHYKKQPSKEVDFLKNKSRALFKANQCSNPPITHPKPEHCI